MVAHDAVGRLLKLLEKQKGREVAAGDWLRIDQQRIDRFAEVTGDIQWIHVDPERATTESPYGTTIAHGFLTLSLIPLLTRSNHPDFFQRNYPGMRYRVNCGLDRVRFLTPVRCGDRIRARMLLHSAEQVADAVKIVYQVTVEVEGSDRPACVCEQIFRVYP
ncbi:MaoC/PaaZ C-terminal domain-containing protein [Geothermobacter ehrlichii]|uniref:MaoC/PaaZ C-terminal domain-containing protein n=1 Tax=Geothermobacter ehrlichii TaxID=213224 RepID=UPI0011E7B4E9